MYPIHELMHRTTERGCEVQNRFARYRAERTACNDDTFDLDKYAEQNWEVDPNFRLGNTVCDLIPNGVSRAEEILQTSRKWEPELKARNKIRSQYTDEEIDMAKAWIETQKKEYTDFAAKDFGLVDTRKLVPQQRLMWIILMLAARDKLKIKGKKKQMLMQMRGKPGTGKSEVLKCAQTDDEFVKYARVAATTGSAGCMIGGTTIDSLVLLPFKNARRCHLDGTRPAHYLHTLFLTTVPNNISKCMFHCFFMCTHRFMIHAFAMSISSSVY